VAIPLGTDHRHLPVRIRRPQDARDAQADARTAGGVPTIVYGYFALLLVTPLLQKIFPACPASTCCRPAW
jgi:phosphate transport system permease protein